MPIRPWPAPASCGLGPPSPRSATLISSASLAPGEAHVRRRAAGVLDRVGERLLHDAVDGELGAGAERAALAGDLERDRQAGGARARDELARARRASAAAAPSGALSSTPSRMSISASASVPAARMRARRLLGALRVAREDAPRAARLHDHHADAVRDHVVHLARDPAALARPTASCASCSRRSAASAARLVQLGGVARAGADGAAAEPAEHDDDHREVQVCRDVVRARAGRPPRRPRSSAASTKTPPRGEAYAPAAVGQDQQREERRDQLGRVDHERRGRQHEHEQRHASSPPGGCAATAAAGSSRRTAARRPSAGRRRRQRAATRSPTSRRPRAVSSDVERPRRASRGLQRQPCPHRVPGAGDRLGHQLAAVERDALLHAEQRALAVGRARRRRP